MGSGRATAVKLAVGWAGHSTATAAEHTLHRDWAKLDSFSEVFARWDGLFVGVVGCPRPPSR